jgi:serine/threonine-protein kinase
MWLGTPAYMAPEQALGDPATDHRADVYAWGVLAYELLAGRHPFSDRTTAQQLAAEHIAEVPAPLSTVRPDLPGELGALVGSAYKRGSRHSQRAPDADCRSASNGRGAAAASRAHVL